MRNEWKAGYLSEVFVSFQGEGSWVGKHQLFIRLAGCKRDCEYCDTSWSRAAKPKYWLLRHGLKHTLRAPNPVTAPGLLPRLKKLLAASSAVHSIALTGGEPTEQPEFLDQLITTLKRNLNNVEILLETNGLEDNFKIKNLNLVDFVSLDIKLPSATRQSVLFSHYRQILPRFPQKQGCIKIVFGPGSTKAELSTAASLAWKYKPAWDLFLQPVTGISWGRPRLAVKLAKLSQAALAVHSQARLLPQIHPILGIK